MENDTRGCLFVISSPSGAGKTTLWQKAAARLDGIERSISMTSRLPRSGEVDGQDYFFVDEQTFKDHIARDCFLEWALVFGTYYGTPRDKVMNLLSRGRDVILIIDVQGAGQVKEKCPEAVLIFIMPPDMETLARRLKDRGTDTDEEIAKRLKIAEQEIACLGDYDYKIINNDLETAVEELKGIIIDIRRTE
ncbi:MAG: guanylate kinase [Candidatus Omnitrophica bacterium]|nr:guanylate kinase [Candidatus Omnitrophota bacterium]